MLTGACGIRRLGGIHTPYSLATLITSLNAEHADLLRLIPLLAGLLEHNVTATWALHHKRWLAQHLQPILSLLEQVLLGLPAGSGLRLLTYTQALIAGLQPMSEPAIAVREALTEGGLQALHVDLFTALQDSLEALYQGLSTDP